MTPLAYCAVTLAAVTLIALVVTIVAPGLAHVFGRRRGGKR